MTTATKFYINGNTYPVKDAIKELGCRFDGERKQWYANDEETAKKAQEIVAKGPQAGAREPKKFRHYKCQSCGIAASRYVTIYGSGECRCCFEERKMGY